jgi:hypothetical protein
LSTYSNIIVEGENYPVKGLKKLLVYVIYALQACSFAVIFGGEYVRPYIAFIPPNILEVINNKKIAFAIGTWLIGSIINNSLQSSGAFEVFCNDELVHNI